MIRDFQAMINQGECSAEIGLVLKQNGPKLMHQRNRLQSRQVQRSTFTGHYRCLRSSILGAPYRRSLRDDSKIAEKDRCLKNESFILLVLAHREGFSPTNNAAVQAVWKDVIS